MSSDELETRLGRIKDRKLATEVRRFLLNLFLLFDDNPPPHIQTYITEIMDLLESEKVPEPIRLSLFGFF
jgi:hypothetical protein